MKIQIPEKYKDLQFTDGEASIVALLLMLGREHGFEYYYTFCSHDVKKIIQGFAGSMTFDSLKTHNLREIIHIVGLDDYNWSMKFRNTDGIYGKRGWKPKTVDYKLTTTRGIGIWCYLMGMWRTRGEDFVNDSQETFEHKHANSSLSQLDYPNFRIDQIKDVP